MAHTPTVYVDLETRQGLHDLKERGAHIYASDCSLILGAYAVDDGEPVVFRTDQELADALREVAGGALFWLVAQNAFFEASVFEAQMPCTHEVVRQHGMWRDTMVAARSQNLPGSLEPMHAALFPELEGKLKEGAWQARFGQDLLSDPKDLEDYCKQDVEMTRRVWKAISHLMCPLDVALTPVDLRINRRGFPIDKRECVVKQAEITNRRAELDKWAEEQGYRPVLQGSGGHLLGSKQKVKGLLEDMSCDKDPRHDELKAKAQEDWQLQAATDKWSKGQSFAAPDSRARGFLMIRATQTGRWTSKDVQVHNMKRPEPGIDPLLNTRQMVRAGEGNVLISADYSQMELRLGFWMARADEQLKALAEGRDLYSEMATSALGRDPTGAERFAMKTALLAILYGGGKPSTLTRLEGIGTPPEVAESIWAEMCKDLRPKLQGAWARLWAKLKENHGTYWGEQDVFKGCTWLRLPLYRRVMLWHDVRWGTDDGGPGPNRKTNYLERLGSMGKREDIWGGTAFAHVVQGTASDVIAGALVQAEAWLEEHSAKVILHVHDEIVLECPEKDADEAAQMLKGWMVAAAKGQPMAVSVGMGKTWAEAK